MRIRKKYAPPAARDAALAALRDYWDEKCAALQIDTPNEGMNKMCIRDKYQAASL